MAQIGKTGDEDLKMTNRFFGSKLDALSATLLQSYFRAIFSQGDNVGQSKMFQSKPGKGKPLINAMTTQ